MSSATIGRLIVGACLSLGCCLVLADLGEAARQWSGRIVDAEAGQPLEGVVVLVYWIRYEPSVGGWAGGEYVGSEETVTGADGRFVVPLRRTYTIPLITKVSGPEIVIFKPGYGQWRVKQSVEKGGEDLIELPRLKTRRERLKFYEAPGRTPPVLVPPDRVKRFREADDAERAYLDLHSR